MMGARMLDVRQSWLRRTTLWAKASKSQLVEHINEQTTDLINERIAAAVLAFCPAPTMSNESSVALLKKRDNVNWIIGG